VDLNKYTKSSETSSSVILTNSPTDITVAGTPFTAANMAHMDDGIEANDTAITAEIADREAAITAEIADREAAITAEASARASADTTLQSNIDAEASTRAAADTTLQSNIDAEASARASADATLQSNIDAEASARASADTTLQSNIDAVDSSAVHKTGAETIAGEKTISDIAILSAGAQVGPNAATDNRDHVAYAGGTGISDFTTALAAKRTIVGTVYHEPTETWYDIISVRHLNGADDGNLYGMYIRVPLSAAGSLEWAKQTFGVWGTPATILDNTNYKTVMSFDASPTDGSTNLVNSDAVHDAIASEASARASADTTLQSNIDAEASARASADTTLQNNINSEASTRASADATLQNNINSEASTRASADTTLQSNIDAEASTRASADTTLQSNIDAVSTTITGELPASGDAGTITASDLYTTMGALVPSVGDKARINGGIGGVAGLSGGDGDDYNISLAAVRRISSTTIRLMGICYFNANDSSGSYTSGAYGRDITSSTTGSCSGYINW
jgi:hypothetical protein